MASQALFITETYIKSNTPLVGSIDYSELVPFVRQVQDVYIQDAIGSKLYGTLQDHLDAQTISANEENLLKLIRPALAQYAYWKALPHIYIKVRSKGVMKGNDDTSQSVDFGELKYLRDEAQSTAQFYMQRVQDYLCKNGHLFPDYVNPDNPLTTNQFAGYTCDIYLDGLEGGWPYGNTCDFNFADLQFYKKYIRNA